MKLQSQTTDTIEKKSKAISPRQGIEPWSPA